MASLETRVKDLATRIATECKALRTLTNGNAASNVALLTTAKGNLVEAVNELKGRIDQVAANAGAVIDDAATNSSSKTYSINKIQSEIAATAQATKDAILGGAGAAYDTLKELQDFLQGEAADIASLMSAVGNRLRVDADQGLTAAQKLTARSNIDVYSKAEIGNPDADFAATFVAGLT